MGRSTETAGWRNGAAFGLVEVVLFAAVFLAGSLGYLPISHTPYLLVLGWLMLFVRGARWTDVGFRWPPHGASALALGALAGVALSVHELIVLEPLVRSYTGASPDLSLFKDLKGNLQATLFWIALSWVLAAFGEEMVWRGYAMNRVAELFGGNIAAWILSTLAVNVVFGIAHEYQDLTGIIVTTIGGLTYAVLYFLAGRNLAVPIMAHGMQNTCDFTFMYIGGIIPGV
ncbi:MAG: CPBP family intramembrane metalloprotease [Alphaproteobacteria bacterium]|nr:CPBP family intramembrane metalloprotease [Alphaproteobacteria bacterium]